MRTYDEAYLRSQHFSESALRVLELAGEEATRLQHVPMEAEHILLALLHPPEVRVAQICDRLGIDPTLLRSQMEARLTGEQGSTRASTSSPSVAFGPGAGYALDTAVDEALRVNQKSVGPEYLFLGVLREGENPGARVLQELGVSLERARQEVYAFLVGE